jgi:hypothetical protein
MNKLTKADKLGFVVFLAVILIAYIIKINTQGY